MSPAPATMRDWALLPSDALHLVFSHLSSFDILYPCQAVCRPWRVVALDPHLWRRIDMRHPPTLDPSLLESLARSAVLRSSGHLHAFHIEHFGSNDLLSFVANQTTGLKHLSLKYSLGVDSPGLVAFVRRCPMLEEIEICYAALKPETFGEIGRACKKLRSFRLVKAICSGGQKSDMDALEIAHSMPKLRVLEFFGSEMSVMGLQAIVANCNCLELLDLSGCFYLEVDVGMEAEVNAKIKTVKLPKRPKLPKKPSYWSSFR